MDQQSVLIGQFLSFHFLSIKCRTDLETQTGISKGKLWSSPSLFSVSASSLNVITQSQEWFLNHQRKWLKNKAVFLLLTWRAWIRILIVFLFLMVHPVFCVWVCSFAKHGVMSFSLSSVPELSLSITHFDHWLSVTCPFFFFPLSRQEDLVQMHSAQNN